MDSSCCTEKLKEHRNIGYLEQVDSKSKQLISKLKRQSKCKSRIMKISEINLTKIVKIKKLKIKIKDETQ